MQHFLTDHQPKTCLTGGVIPFEEKNMVYVFGFVGFVVVYCGDEILKNALNISFRHVLCEEIYQFIFTSGGKVFHGS